MTTAAIERRITSIFAKLDLTPNPDDHRRVLAILRYLGRRDAAEGQQAGDQAKSRRPDLIEAAGGLKTGA